MTSYLAGLARFLLPHGYFRLERYLDPHSYPHCSVQVQFSILICTPLR